MALVGQTLAYDPEPCHMMSLDHEQTLCDSPNHNKQATQSTLCCKVNTHCFTALAMGYDLIIGNLATNSDAVALPLDIHTFLLVFPNFRPPIFA
ncbi:hypothetical protein PQI64_18940 [Shewanella bicestrii]